MSLAARIPGAAFPDVFILPSGTTLVLRSMERGDRWLQRDLFARLSPESRYRRYHTPKHRLSETELTYLSDVDQVRHDAVAAVDQRDGSFAGVARYVRRSDRTEAAELAIEVVDGCQGMGVGSALIARLLDRAIENGYSVLTATTLRENPPARALLSRFGFRPCVSSGHEIELVRSIARGAVDSDPCLQAAAA